MGRPWSDLGPIKTNKKGYRFTNLRVVYLMHILIAGRMYTVFSFLMSWRLSERKKKGSAKSALWCPFAGGVGGRKLFGQHSFELATFHFPKLQNSKMDWSGVGAKKLPLVKMPFWKKWRVMSEVAVGGEMITKFHFAKNSPLSSNTCCSEHH